MLGVWGEFRVSAAVSGLAPGCLAGGPDRLSCGCPAAVVSGRRRSALGGLIMTISLPAGMVSTTAAVHRQKPTRQCVMSATPADRERGDH